MAATVAPLPRSTARCPRACVDCGAGGSWGSGIYARRLGRPPCHGRLMGEMSCTRCCSRTPRRTRRENHAPALTATALDFAASVSALPGRGPARAGARRRVLGRARDASAPGLALTLATASGGPTPPCAAAAAAGQDLGRPCPARRARHGGSVHTAARWWMLTGTALLLAHYAASRRRA